MDVPAHVRRYGSLIKRLKAKSYLTHSEQDLLCNAQYELALWACAQEHVSATIDNVSTILGPDAPRVMQWYYRQRTAEVAPTKTEAAPKPAPEAAESD